MGLTRQTIATCLSYRTQYIRLVTTQVLRWGLGARSTENVSNTHHPVFLDPDGMRSVVFKQVSAGAGFSCAVRPRYTLRKCETNTRPSCLPFFARTLFFQRLSLSLLSLSLSHSFFFYLSVLVSIYVHICIDVNVVVVICIIVYIHTNVVTSRPPPLPKDDEKHREEILDRIEEG